MTTAFVRGINISYDDVGQGAPLVFVHGHPFDRSMWQDQAGALRSQYRLIAPDLRGYGETTAVPGIVSLTEMAADIAALLDELGIEQAMLAGLSMGGQIVLEFYRLFPSRVRALILADTSPQAETEAGKRIRRDTAERLLREGMSLYADETLPKMLSAHSIAHQPEVADRLLAMMQRTPPVGAAAALRGRAERPDYVELLSRISVPTLVVVGSDDAFTPVSDAEFMHARIPSAQLAVIAETGHVPNMEKPDEFNRILIEFLQTVR